MKLSASQIKTFRLCRRKWALEKIAGIKPPPSKHQAFGLKVHKALEDWVSKGTPIPDTPAGRAAMPAVRHVPAPGDASADTEAFFEFPSPSIEGVSYRGYVDLFHADEDGQPVIVDYKTTGDDLKWAKSQAELAEDEQATIYAWAALEHLFPWADRADLKWIYLARNRPRSKVVRLRVVQDADQLPPDSAFGAAVTLDHVLEKMAGIDDTAREILALRDECSGDAMVAAPNPSACGAYGGCPHVGVCNLSPREMLEGTMGIREIMEKRKAAQAAAKSEPEPAPEASPTPAAEPDQGDGVNSPPKTTRTKAARKPAASKAEEKAPADPVRAALHALADAIADRLA